MASDSGQCGSVVRALALKSGNPGLKPSSHHKLKFDAGGPRFNFSASLEIINWFASGQLVFLTVVFVVVALLISFHWPRKACMGGGWGGQVKYV